MAIGTTVFPTGLGQGSTESELINKMAEVIAFIDPTTRSTYWLWSHFGPGKRTKMVEG